MSRPTLGAPDAHPDSLTIDQPAPAFLGQPALDALTEVCLELAAQLWSTRDRMARLERLIGAHTGIPDLPRQIEDYEPSAPQRETSRQERDAMVRQVLGPLVRLGGPAGGEA